MGARIAYGNAQPSSLLRLYPTDTMKYILDHCLVKVEINYEEVDKYSLPCGTLYFIVNAIMTFNGLTPAGGKKLERTLNFLKEYALSQFQEKDWVGRPPPPYFSIISVSYFSISKGVPFSTDKLVDEPYVLVQAWMTIADAEHTYYKLLEEKGNQDLSTQTPRTTTPSPPRDFSQILSDKFSFHLPPLPEK